MGPLLEGRAGAALPLFHYSYPLSPHHMGDSEGAGEVEVVGRNGDLIARFA